MSAAAVTDLRRRARILRRLALHHGSNRSDAERAALYRSAERLEEDADRLAVPHPVAVFRPFAAGCPDRCDTRRLCLTGCVRGRRP